MHSLHASDLEGVTSTAELSKLLQAPVILCVDGTKTTGIGNTVEGV